ncbi:glycine-rich domain-containing protein [Clostridium sp. E02]|uniref:glycine-rich domain-containing protein n=1 Tax=Clostridium sp. E02 TaxID=2487134 RepID=UPI000F549024|nr:hypothetical protein [Clostridium sp. E02]
MGKIWMPGGVGGADLDVINATAPDVLTGKVTVDKEGEPLTGTMPNRGAVKPNLNAGGSYAIPAGYHNGGGKVTANSLASQTPATASANRIISGYSAYVNGIKVDGTLAIQSVVSFNLAQYATQQIIASWALPSVGPWSGIRVMCKQGSYPTNANDGTLFYEGSGTYHIGTLGTGIWYFRAWNYITTSSGRFYGGYVQTAINNIPITGTQTFISSGIFTVPAKVYAVNVFLVGGGGGGAGGSAYKSSHAGDGGGGGFTKTYWNVGVSPGQTIAVSIGAGGPAGDSPSSDGGNTNFGSYLAQGGKRGGYWPAQNISGGGSGGGRGTSGDAGYPGGIGGSNGSDGGSAGYPGGIGQHTTTRAFGQSSGTLYAGGGGGGGNGSNGGNYRGVGGAGGGGNGRDGWNAGSPGAAHTGGGGGGGWCGWRDENGIHGSDGGSGICIVRWGY